MTDKNQHKDWQIGDRIISTDNKGNSALFRYIGTVDNGENPMLKATSRTMGIFYYENIDLKLRKCYDR